MSTTVKLQPSAVLAMANNTYQKLLAAKKANDDLFTSFKRCATGNSGKSYWQGKRAFAWYCHAVRNCANSYYRVYNLASTYKSMCKTAQDAIMADSQMSKNERSTYDSLAARYYNFNSLMASCESAYNKVVSWGKS